MEEAEIAGGILGQRVGLLHDRETGAVKDAVSKAISDGVLTMANVKYAIIRGKDESELEDFYLTSAYETTINKHFSVALPNSLKGGRKKWSDRVGTWFTNNAQIWDDTVKAAVKARVAEAVASAPKKALSSQAKAPFDALVRLLKERLAGIVAV